MYGKSIEGNGAVLKSRVRLNSSLFRRCLLFAMTTSLCVAITAAIVHREMLHRVLLTKEVYTIQGECLVKRHASRWSGLVDRSYPSHHWYISTGYFQRMWSIEIRSPVFNSDGTVRLSAGLPSDPWYKDRSEVPDQKEPSAPWVVVGQTFEEWWAEIPESNKVD